MTPAITTYPFCGIVGQSWCAAEEMITISNVPQPMSCKMFRPVGRYERRAPNRPRSSTIDGARSLLGQGAESEI